MMKGNTLFAGDSMTVGLSPFVQVDGLKRTMAEVSRQSTWLLQQLRGTDLHSAKNLVILIGANDLASLPTSLTLSNILACWAHAKSQGIRVFAMTLPPNKGWAPFASNFAAVEAKRQALNAGLREAFVQGKADGLIDLSSLMADPQDPQKLAPAFDSGDHLHPRKDAMGALLTRAFSSLDGGSASTPLASLPDVPVPSEESAMPLLLLVGVGGIITYLLTRKR